MENREYDAMYLVEQSHFWYVGMRRITDSLLHLHLSNKKKKILDAGCGTGMNMVFLQKYGQVSGCDISTLALKLARNRGLKDIKIGSIDNLPYPEKTFDLVCCFDVLGQKEVKNPSRAVNEFYRVLKPGGMVFIRVAALNWLYGSHDIHVHTRHRYTVGELERLLENSGFKIIKSTYVNTILFPIVIIKRIYNRVFNNYIKESDVKPVGRIPNLMMLVPLYIESILIKYISFPIGSSSLVLARRK